jgi:hypothetical protein
MSEHNPPQPDSANDIPEQLKSTHAFTEEERESLINEIVDEIRKDSLKEDSLKKLKKVNWVDTISNFFHHPAILLIIGFILTGLIGTLLTAAWQGREWDRQQQRLIDIHGIDLKYGIIDDITKAVGERNAATRDMMYPLFDNLDNRSLEKEEVEPIKNWQIATYNWLVSSETLRMKIRSHIKNPDALKCFERIVERENQITGEIALIKGHLAEYNNPAKNNETLKELDSEIYNNIGGTGEYLNKGTGEDLNKLVAIITLEIKADVQGR